MPSFRRIIATTMPASPFLEHGDDLGLDES
jgi:hypothetical protein